jgi:hypothetical protein
MLDPTFDPTIVPTWVLLASVLVWLLALAGLMALGRMIWQFTRRGPRT